MKGDLVYTGTNSTAGVINDTTADGNASGVTISSITLSSSDVGTQYDFINNYGDILPGYFQGVGRDGNSSRPTHCRNARDREAAHRRTGVTPPVLHVASWFPRPVSLCVFLRWFSSSLCDRTMLRRPERITKLTPREESCCSSTAYREALAVLRMRSGTTSRIAVPHAEDRKGFRRCREPSTPQVR